MPRGVPRSRREIARLQIRQMTKRAHRLQREAWILRCSAAGLKKNLEEETPGKTGEAVNLFLRAQAEHFEKVLGEAYSTLWPVAQEMNELDHLVNPGSPL